jgi:hypothetical protein
VTEVFPIRSRSFARAMRVQKIQHLAAAAILIMAALSHLTDPKSHHVVLPLLELATGIALIGVAIVERFRHTHARFGWFELAGAAMTFIEAMAKLNEPHKPLFHVLTFIPPVLLLFFGLFDARIRKGLRMEANDEAFLLQTRIFRRRRIRWDGLRTYALGPTSIDLTHEDGRTFRLKTKDLDNREEATAWAEEQFVRRGLTRA